MNRNLLGPIVFLAIITIIISIGIFFIFEHRLESNPQEQAIKKLEVELTAYVHKVMRDENISSLYSDSILEEKYPQIYKDSKIEVSQVGEYNRLKILISTGVSPSVSITSEYNFPLESNFVVEQIVYLTLSENKIKEDIKALIVRNMHRAK